MNETEAFDEQTFEAILVSAPRKCEKIHKFATFSSHVYFLQNNKTKHKLKAHKRTFK